ncbi:MAG: GNAT family N-acetyltransferase [Deltaproteobacteria bacterium]|nr:GNAT family N-acetyltransferase [Deltaproteobacteria bacterium]NIS76499.1 GNAT family N-acetyltransferase [Deltaproteobacteria bacterium]
MIIGYPKEVTLRDGMRVTIKPFEKKEKESVFEFFVSLPEEDRLYLKDDVTDPLVVEKWARELNYDKVFPLLAWYDNRVVGDGTLHRTITGWMHHIGTIRIAIARDFQRKGLGSVIAQELFFYALKCGLEKIVAEMMEIQYGALKVFEKLGFIHEATLKNHVLDQIGVKHDLLIYTKDLVQFWNEIRDHEFFSIPTRHMEE